MKANAIQKINSEMEKNRINFYIQHVGNFLISYVEANPEAAEKVLQSDKSISKSLNFMRSEAEKKKVGNVAVLTDLEGFDLVLKYYGIEAAPASVITAAPQEAYRLVIEGRKTDIDFDIKLEDLL